MFDAHSSRIRFYCDSSLEVTSDFKFQIQSDESNNCSQIEKITDHRFQPALEFLVHSKGFDVEDSTWEPKNNLKVDVPDLIDAYCENIRDEFKKKD